LNQLAIGAPIIVRDAKSVAYKYKVTRQLLVTPDEAVYMAATGREQVTLISCYGEDTYEEGAVTDKSHRLITIAEPVKGS
jgi:sortase (surface protein transpeptidase)